VDGLNVRAVDEWMPVEAAMSAHLRLVANNRISGTRVRVDGRALHALADRLTEEIQCGRREAAHVLASRQHLSPFGVAIVATWMVKAGVSEAEIIGVVA
jgi:hypothetical protein